MDIVKTAVDWTKAEMLSSSIFVVIGVAFLLASYGFWQIGKTDLARAYVVPFAVAGGLLLIIGVGIFAQSFGRLSSFPAAYEADAGAFLASEVQRAEKVLGQYRVAVSWVIPIIVIVASVALMLFTAPFLRAICVTTIALMAVLLMLDSNANARLLVYQAQVLEAVKVRNSE